MLNCGRFISALLLIICLFPKAVMSQERYQVGVIADDIVTYTLFDALSQDFDVEIEYVEFLNLSHALRAVKERKIDFLANVSYSEKRSEWLEFSTPTNIDYTYIYSLDGSTDIAQNAILGIPRDSILPEVLKDVLPFVRFVELDNERQGIRLLNKGELDGVLSSIYRLKYMTSKGLSSYPVNIDEAMHPVSVVSAKDRHKEALKLIGDFAVSPKMVKLLRQNVYDYQTELTLKALQIDVANKGVDISKPLLISLKSMDQFVSYHHDGSVNGITADVLFEACKILQVNCQLVSDEQESCSNMFDSIKTQKVDLIAPLVITEKRKREYAFSAPYYSAKGILVKRANYKDNAYRAISEMFVERIGVVEGDFLESYMRNMFPGKEIHTYKTLHDLMNALLESKIDYSFLMRSTFYNFVRDSDDATSIVEEHDVGVIIPYEVAFGFQNNHKGAVLANLFTHAINLINTKAIIEKYDTPPDWSSSIKLQKELRFRGLGAFFGIAIFLLIATVFFYMKSITDELTGLRNRLSLYRRYGRSFSSSNILVYLDVNKFKFINDNYGHLIGDKVLQTLAKNVKKHWPGQAYRIGGDEFILICKDKGEQIDELLNVIREFSFSDRESGLEHKVTLSIGIARNLDKTYSLDEVLHIADQSMYDAKSKSRVRARVR